MNNCTIQPAVEIAADDPITKAVMVGIKSFSGVSATVKEGIITIVRDHRKSRPANTDDGFKSVKTKKSGCLGID